MKLEFSRQIFEKSSNIKFHEDPSSGSRDVPCGQTDRHDEANRSFSKFCKRVKKTPCLLHALYIHLWVLYKSHSKQLSLSSAALTECSLEWWRCVYCAVRTGLLYVVQMNDRYSDCLSVAQHSFPRFQVNVDMLPSCGWMPLVQLSPL
jgi:hypothetical protein